MKKPRKINTIKALKWEIEYYKRQTFPVNVVYENKLRHLRLTSIFSPDEVAGMPRDCISDLLIHRMTKAFADYIMRLPIETSYDEEYNVYKAKLDLWVKPKKF